MEKILTALLELYVPIIIGALYAIKARPKDDIAQGLSRILLYTFLPLLLFTSTYGSGKPVASLFQMGLSVAISASVSLAASYVLTKDRELMLLSTYVNAGYLPIPLAYVLWGSESLPLVGFYVLFNASLGYLLAPLLLKGDLNEGLRELSRFPPLYAIIGGLLLSTFGVKLPRQLLETVSKVGSSAPYLALFTLGSQSMKVKPKNLAQAAKVAVVRFLIAPAVMWLASPLYLEPGSLPHRVAMLEAAMPPAVTSAILCTVYNPSSEKASSVVVILTTVATLTLPFLLALLS
ncbi:MAG: AEC family transporter [Thermofilaceae archaeon]|nr:AEC family transporter [Thermofilaceae archaeon]MCX8180912.1 AEC family transporter [Thermofilaceae archaeon]MDW8003477.1 AEC family transporter [Thermofilaceae archaeon]